MSFYAGEIFCVERIDGYADGEVDKEKPNALSDDGVGLRFGEMRLVGSGWF